MTEWSKVVDSRSIGNFLMGSKLNFPITTIFFSNILKPLLLTYYIIFEFYIKFIGFFTDNTHDRLLSSFSKLVKYSFNLRKKIFF